MQPKHVTTQGHRLLFDVIGLLTGDRSSPYASSELNVTAKVDGKVVVDQELIRCVFTQYFDKISISVYWEEAGFKNYKSMGLYGLMDTLWQEMTMVDDILVVTGNRYEVEIALPAMP